MVADFGVPSSIVGPHKVSELLTCLLQASPHLGLEVQNKSGDWISAALLENSLVVNNGCVLEAISGGVCPYVVMRWKLVVRESGIVDCGREWFGGCLGRRSGRLFLAWGLSWCLYGENLFRMLDLCW
jgi:hypothetical protein